MLLLVQDRSGNSGAVHGAASNSRALLKVKTHGGLVVRRRLRAPRRRQLLRPIIFAGAATCKARGPLPRSAAVVAGRARHEKSAAGACVLPRMLRLAGNLSRRGGRS